MTDQYAGDLPQIAFDPSIGGRNDSSLAAAIHEALARGGPGYLRQQRWFGDKSRTITNVNLDDLGIVQHHHAGPERIMLAIVRVGFASGDESSYFLPLSLSNEGSRSIASIAEFEGGSQTWTLGDAAGSRGFHAWLLNAPNDPDAVSSNRGSFVWNTSHNLSEFAKRANLTASRLSSAEQSNSAVIYGEALLTKVFRKLRSGINPDIEISRFLTDQGAFSHFPALLADLMYRSPSGNQFAVAMMLPFVPNRGDAWQYLQARLGEMLRGESVELDTIAPLRLLGRRTGQLHTALASDRSIDAFAPEPTSPVDADRWISALGTSIRATFTELEQHIDRLPTPLGQVTSALIADQTPLLERAQGFNVLAGIAKIRVHGDYHLGQVLVTPNEDFVILDFEGEPTRPISERREKTSPLKDVAGMLRSIAYARAAAVQGLPEEAGRAAAADQLAIWEADARDAFLAGYREETLEKGVSFVPAAQEAFDAALAAWELDKALYEVNYELNNRPTWLPIPLRALLNRSDRS